MKATLNLEYYGANESDYINSFRPRIDAISSGLSRALIGESTCRRPWVAEIVGKTESGKLKRNFLSGKRDYSKANSKGSRGVRLWFILESDRLYEVHRMVSWKSSENYFCATTQDGFIYRMSKEEVDEWVSVL